MAKKKAGGVKQKKMPEVFDHIPDEVQEAADTYRGTLRKRMKLQGDENTQRGELIALMKEHEIKIIPVSDEDDKVLELVEGEVKVKTRKRKMVEANGQDEDE